MQDVTKSIAREMRDLDPAIGWRRVPFNKKCSIMERINSLLAKEGIPAVEIDLVGWRMSRAIDNLKHAEGRCLWQPIKTETDWLQPALLRQALQPSGVLVRETL